MRGRALARAAWPFALLAIAWLLTVWRVVGLGGLRDPLLLYWHDWQDQALYVRSASALATGNLDPALHYYPLLYPLLGAPFLHVWPSQPFFAVNFVCYLLAFAGFRSVARGFGLPAWIAVLLFAATTLAQFGIAKLWIEPWTTTPSAALLWLALGAMARLWERDVVDDRNSSISTRHPGLVPGSTGPQDRRLQNIHGGPRDEPGVTWRDLRASGTARNGLILGLALGLIPFARPGDTIIGAIIGVSAAIALLRVRDLRGAHYALMAFGIAVILLGSLFVAIYGFGPSPYMLYSAQYGFNFAWLGWKAYVLLVDPRAWFGEGIGLFEYAPWLLLGAAGLIAAIVSTPRERRPVTLMLAAVGLAYTILMLAYVDLLPTGLWRFNNLHYFKWLFPLFGLFALRFVLDAWRRRSLLLALLPVLLALAIKLEPVRVADDAPARMVVFPAPMGALWIPTYFATAWLTDARGEQRNSFDYHQILVAGRVRAVALRRQFAGKERWIGDDHVRAQLEGHDTGGYAPLYLTGPWPKLPLARYGMRVGLGLPDWFHAEEPRPKP